ncbi:MAG: group III truncated hemoglobin [Hyphomicrobiaceae bacterium]
MNVRNIQVRPFLRRQPAHPDISPDQISRLVDDFYSRARANSRLGPIFQDKIGADWDVHLLKMKKFWRSVLLRSGEYHGKPVPTHARLNSVVAEDFQIWLKLFRTTATEIFSPEPRAVVIEAAERIASSLWLSMRHHPTATKKKI